MLTSTITGPAWQRHLKSRDEAVKKREERRKRTRHPARRRPPSAGRKIGHGRGARGARRNAQKLIRGGALVTPGTDSYWAAAPELTRTPKFEEQDHGIGTIMAIEGLVELAHDAGAGDRRRNPQRRDGLHGGSPISAPSGPASSPTSSSAADPLSPDQEHSQGRDGVQDGRAVDRATARGAECFPSPVGVKAERGQRAEVGSPSRREARLFGAAARWGAGGQARVGCSGSGVRAM